MSGFDFSMGEVVAILSAMAGVMLVLTVLYIFGTITMVIAFTHSVKKRIVSGEDFSAGNIFLWYLGWSLAMGYSAGLATVIYFFVKRSEINETKQKTGSILNNIRYMSMQQGQQQYRQY